MNSAIIRRAPKWRSEIFSSLTQEEGLLKDRLGAGNKIVEAVLLLLGDVTFSISKELEVSSISSCEFNSLVDEASVNYKENFRFSFEGGKGVCRRRGRCPNSPSPPALAAKVQGERGTAYRLV